MLTPLSQDLPVNLSPSTPIDSTLPANLLPEDPQNEPAVGIAEPPSQDEFATGESSDSPAEPESEDSLVGSLPADYAMDIPTVDSSDVQQGPTDTHTPISTEADEPDAGEVETDVALVDHGTDTDGDASTDPPHKPSDESPSDDHAAGRQDDDSITIRQPHPTPGLPTGTNPADVPGSTEQGHSPTPPGEWISADNEPPIVTFATPPPTVTQAPVDPVFVTPGTLPRPPQNDPEQATAPPANSLRDEEVGVTVQPHHAEPETPLHWSGVGPDDRLVFYLGALGCSDVTDGGDIEAGKDDFTMVYGVVVRYDDGTSRAWGDYLYEHWRVGDPWNETRSRIDKIMVAVNLFAPQVLEEFHEARSPGRRIHSIHISTVMAETDPTGRGVLATKNNSSSFGPARISRFLNGMDWSDYSEETASHFTKLSSRLRVRLLMDHTGADVIGSNDHHFTRSQLQGLFMYATRVRNAGDVEQIVSNPTRPGTEDSWFPGTLDRHGLPGIDGVDDVVPSSVYGRGTGDRSKYEYFIHCLVGPDSAFEQYIRPVFREDPHTPFVDLDVFSDPTAWQPEAAPFWNIGDVPSPEDDD